MPTAVALRMQPLHFSRCALMKAQILMGTTANQPLQIRSSSIVFWCLSSVHFFFLIHEFVFILGATSEGVCLRRPFHRVSPALYLPK